MIMLKKGSEMKMLMIILAGFILAGCAAPVATNSMGANSGTYNWLHPKQGMVKVDRATNAIVVAP